MNRKFTFSEVANYWLNAKRQLVKLSSYCAYSLILKSHLLPKFQNHIAIQESEVQEFVLIKFNCGLARKTVKDILATLKAIVKFGNKHCGFPCESWEIAMPTETEAKPLPTLSIANHRKLLRHLLESPTPQSIGVLIALTTGIRIGEICALRWCDIDMLHRLITVRQTVSRIYNSDKNSTERILSSPKTKTSNREIPICLELYKALRNIKGTTELCCHVLGGLNTPKEPRSYREYFTRLLNRLGIPKIVFHGLRHTFATRCIECMCDYKTVSVILGHSNVATTMNLYVHPNREQKKRCVDRMIKSLGKLYHD